MNMLDPNQIAGAALSEIVKSLAKGATVQGLQLLNKIRERFSKDERATRALANLEVDPTDEDYRDYFGKHLRRLLDEDVEFQKQLAALLPRRAEQTMSVSGSGVIEDALQRSDSDGSIQIMKAEDQGRISNSRQEQRRN